MRASIVSILFCLASGAALASDGVLEINQACAAGPGCFAGDAAGFPVTIDGSAGTSYLLTSDLVVPDEDTDGIRLQAPNAGVTHDVDIDLGGFRIVRAGCEAATSSCAPGSGTGTGIRDVNELQDVGISVRNGSVVGMGEYGVRLGSRSRVSGVRSRWNRLVGILMQGGATITGCDASDNGDDGIAVGTEAHVTGNTASDNGGIGIASQLGNGTFTGNTVHGNAGSGISVGSDATVSGNTVTFNGTNPSNHRGIRVGGGSTVTHNTSSQNTGHGIEAGVGSLVHANAVYSNTGNGLQITSGVGFGRNVIRDNGGTVAGGGIDLGDNVCDTSTTCP